MGVKIKSILVVWMSIGATLLWGQGTQSVQNKYGLSAEGGFVIAHRGNMLHLVEDFSYTGIFHWERTFKDSSLNINFNYPTWGVKAMFTYLGSPSYMGNAYSINPYFGFTHLRSKKVTWRTHINLGLGYVTLPFSKDDNLKNIAVGSNINVSVRLNTELAFKIKDFELFFGAGMSHLSNAATSIPNLGANIANLELGLKYAPNTPQFQPRGNYKLPYDSKIHYKVGLIGGFRELPPALGPTYGVLSAHMQAEKLLSQKNGVSLSLDTKFNGSHVERVARNEALEAKNNWDYILIGLAPGYILQIKDLQMMFQFGFYLKNTFDFDGLMYHRVGMRYRVYKNWYANLSLYTHFAKADHMEIGIFYQLW